MGWPEIGPGSFVFKANTNYDWGYDKVFQVKSNTHIYFEQGAWVKARMLSSFEIIEDVKIAGYGVLEAAYARHRWLEPGWGDDVGKMTLGLYGKNIEIKGLTIAMTNPECDSWPYCLNVNADWAPLSDGETLFSAGELTPAGTTGGMPPLAWFPGNCQDSNMDGSYNPNSENPNCPRTKEEGPKISFVKCLGSHTGQDGINPGIYGDVSSSFIKVADDSIKVWDSYQSWSDMTVWQLHVGWVINLGFWQWDQWSVGATVDGVEVIHNENWQTSCGWPVGDSKQCIIGTIYGAGKVIKDMRLSNIHVEGEAQCAVGFIYNQGNPDWGFTHLTQGPQGDGVTGCVGNTDGLVIENIVFDNDFIDPYGCGTQSVIAGLEEPNPGCGGDFSGKIVDMQINGALVHGRPMSSDDFWLEGGVWNFWIDANLVEQSKFVV